MSEQWWVIAPKEGNGLDADYTVVGRFKTLKEATVCFIQYQNSHAEIVKKINWEVYESKS